MVGHAIQRTNMVERQAEAWRPPLLTNSKEPGQRFLAAVRRWFDLQAGSIWADLKPELASARGALLDVGCGAQPYRGLLPPDATYLGIDRADAEAHFGYRVPDAIYYDGETWPVANGGADVVLITETLEHVFNTAAFLDEARRCLRPGGRLLLTVPFAARWHFIPYDFWRFTPSSLNRLLAAAKFDEIVVYARGNAVTVACYKMMALFLPFLFPQSLGRLHSLAWRLVGLLLAPAFVVCAAIGNLSLCWPGGDDCLGYTVLARAGSGSAPEGSR